MSLDNYTTSVRKFIVDVPKLKVKLSQSVKHFHAGNITNCLDAWRTITDNEDILETVRGLPVELEISRTAELAYPSYPHSRDLNALQSEISNLLRKGVITTCALEPGSVISPIFLREKADGKHRLILNLKRFNTLIEDSHFKMETLQSMIPLIQRNCYMCTVDLKDAYYSVAIKEDCTKFFTFQFNGIHYKFLVLPNGYKKGPLKFTKLTKAPLAILRLQGHLVAIYIDDIFIVGLTFHECVGAVKAVIELFTNLGFYVHPEKSMFIPMQIVTLLGFIINSVTMTLTLTEEKKLKILKLCANIYNCRHITIRKLASLIGTLSSSFPGVQYGPLYYRALERDKTIGLAANQGNFQAKIKLNDSSLRDLQWWIDNIHTAYKDIYPPEIDSYIHTDASNSGWGAVYEEVTAPGTWAQEETELHINAKELLAIKFGLMSLVVDPNLKHIKIWSDNTTAVQSLNKLGTCRSEACHKIVVEIWEWARKHGYFLTAAHIPGIENEEADRQSRAKHNSELEWQIDSTILRECFDKLNVMPEVDMFATRINTQLTRYYSYLPDPYSEVVDAFSISWSDCFGYMFPPFCLLGKVINKIVRDRTQAVVIAPKWPNQCWYPLIFKYCLQTPIFLSPRKTLLRQPMTGEPHPLWRKLELMVCHIGRPRN